MMPTQLGLGVGSGRLSALPAVLVGEQRINMVTERGKQASPGELVKGSFHLCLLY